MIRKFAGHDTETPPGTVVVQDYTLNEYIVKTLEAEGLTNPPESCYTIKTDPVYRITTGMCLRDFKDGIGQAYWNRDRETLERLLESLQNAV